MAQKSESSAKGKPECSTETPLMQNDDRDYSPNHFITALLCFISLILGLVQAFPIAILVPESVDLGLTVGQSVFIVSARPASSLLVLFLQPFMNRLNVRIYLIFTGLVSCLGFASFYFLVQYHSAYLYGSVFVRFVTGTALYLINNKTVVGITNHLKGNVTTSTTLWETFFFLGIAGGAAVGSLVDTAIGFPLTMVVAGLILLLNVLTLTCIFPSPPEDVEKTETGLGFREVLNLNLTVDMMVYCWIPMVCVGGGLSFGEGVSSEFYRAEYSKSIRFGGFLQLEFCIVYSITAAIIGMLRNRWPILKIIGLVVGLFCAGLVFPFVGPVRYVNPPGVPKIVMSASAFSIIMVFFCAVMLNSVTLSALTLSKRLPTGAATSLAVNAVNVAYSFGSIIGPIIGGQLLLKYNYETVWATASPFYIIGAILVGGYASEQYNKKELKLTEP